MLSQIQIIQLLLLLVVEVVHLARFFSRIILFSEWGCKFRFFWWKWRNGRFYSRAGGGGEFRSNGSWVQIIGETGVVSYQFGLVGGSELVVGLEEVVEYIRNLIDFSGRGWWILWWQVLILRKNWVGGGGGIFQCRLNQYNRLGANWRSTWYGTE